MKRFITLLVLLALTAVLIASNTTYEQQTLIPTLQRLLPNQPFASFLSQFEITYWGRLISVETSGYYHFVEFLIRKGTHFSGYGLIAVIMYLFYQYLPIRFKASAAVVTIFVIASLDEFRQSFIDGRTGTFKDVLIDTAGAILFVSIAKCLLWGLRKIKKTSSDI